MEFINAQEKAKKNPDTFEAPSIEELRVKCVVGDYLKVCTYQERFWVEVTAIHGKHITARVANDLVSETLKYGETVYLQLHHAYDYLPQDTKTVDSEEDNVEAICDTCNRGLEK